MQLPKRCALPYPTSATVEGPRLSGQGSVLTVEYDYTGLDGAVVWTRLTFRGVLAFRYCDAACCTAEDVQAYNYLALRSDSEWLTQVRQLWVKSMAGQATSGQAASYREWRMYFDDAGCVGVIAQSFEVG